MARNDTALAVVDQQKAAVLEQVVVQGDLSKLQPAERVAYYKTVCESVGLNPFTKPFEYITLNGKLTLYAKRDATDQLRSINGVSVEITSREMHDNGIYVVTARAKDRNGRTDEAIGAVSIAGLKGDALANAIMKAETKAKRRVTLSICGLGWLDETEVATVPDATAVDVDMETGEIKSPMKNVTPPKSESPPMNGAAPGKHPMIDDPGHKKARAYFFACASEVGVKSDDAKEWAKLEWGQKQGATPETLLDIPAGELSTLANDIRAGRISADMITSRLAMLQATVPVA